ncbi:ankyrin repeat domain-containing protein [Sedimentitalea sp.]|uniref:ankyrin repeat domain-containing protein n=1 Tax=Sedimentitalea sp. TaxID=2048915 RepID=UPI003296EC9D
MKCLPLMICLALAASASLSGPISDAAKNGQNAYIDQLVMDGADVNEKDIATPLHWAVLHGHDKTVQLLIDLGADPSTNVKMLGTPLHAAIRFGEIRTLNALLSAGANPNVRDLANLTPLMVSVIENRLDAAQALIRADANVNAVGNSSENSEAGSGPVTALHLARRRSFFELEEVLVAVGARPHPIEDPATFMETADWMRGYHISKALCGTCHAIETGKPESSGIETAPSLVGIFGSRVAADKDFDYSLSLTEFAGNWTRNRLFSYARTPKLIVPGTKMNGPGNATRQMIADVVVYLARSGAIRSAPALPTCPRFGWDLELTVDCVCVPPIGKGPRVNVKGSGPYANQSHVCLSAVHAGVIGRDGGSIRVVPRPPQSRYVGSTSNGVYSSGHSSEQTSFDFEPTASKLRDK